MTKLIDRDSYDFMDFDALIPYRHLMAQYAPSWCFAGGWAIDGLIGRITRPHADVDVAIWRNDQLTFRQQFADWEWQTYINRVPRPWPADEFLILPAHNAHGRKNGQELEILLMEKEGDQWVFRRNPAIRMPVSRTIIPTRCGFNVLNPAIVLLFKSKEPGEKDLNDFAEVLPHLGSFERQWLKQALAEIDPTHVWLKNL